MKGPANFVSAADHRAEETLHAELMKARPGYGFLGEEGGRRAGADKTHTWIVDPLDGTTNFLHGIPQFAISIALERDATIVAGLIYNPANDEMFVAERTRSSTTSASGSRRETPCRRSDCLRTTASWPRGYWTFAERSGRDAGARCRPAPFRRSRADLAWVAAGRIDGYWERHLKPWDLAAGLIMVREAGGFVSNCDGGDDIFEKGHVVAGNEIIHKELVAVLKGAGKG